MSNPVVILALLPCPCGFRVLVRQRARQTVPATGSSWVSDSQGRRGFRIDTVGNVLVGYFQDVILHVNRLNDWLWRNYIQVRGVQCQIL